MSGMSGTVPGAGRQECNFERLFGQRSNTCFLDVAAARAPAGR